MKHNSKGFSLVELIIAIAIMAVLVGIMAPTLFSKIQDAKRSRDMTNARHIESILTEALVNGEIEIPEDTRWYGHGAWVMICRGGKNNAPEPYHNKSFKHDSIWCGADKGITVGGTTSADDWDYCDNLARILEDAGVNLSTMKTASNGDSKSWDWIIVEVCYDSLGGVRSRIYSGYKNENGGINRTPSPTNIEKLMNR